MNIETRLNELVRQESEMASGNSSVELLKETVLAETGLDSLGFATILFTMEQEFMLDHLRWHRRYHLSRDFRRTNRIVRGGSNVKWSCQLMIKSNAGHGGGEERHYELNMPQMSLGGLSEAWLFREIGDIHWTMLSSGLESPSSELADANGDRLYATFTRLKLTSTASLLAFAENESITARGKIARFGGGAFSLATSRSATIPD